MRNAAMLVLVFIFQNILRLTKYGRVSVSLFSKTCSWKYIRLLGAKYMETFGCMSMPFGCMSMDRLGCMYAVVGCKSAVIGCKSAETFGCMYAEVGCKFHTAESLSDSR